MRLTSRVCDKGTTVKLAVQRLWHTSTSWLSSVHTSMARHLPPSAFQKGLPVITSAPMLEHKAAIRWSTCSL